MAMAYIYVGVLLALPNKPKRNFPCLQLRFFETWIAIEKALSLLEV